MFKGAPTEMKFVKSLLPPTLILSICLSCFAATGFAKPADDPKEQKEPAPAAANVTADEASDPAKADAANEEAKAPKKEAEKEAPKKCKKAEKKTPAKPSAAALRPMDEAYLKRLANATKMEGPNRAIHNVLAAEDAKKVSLNHDILKAHHNFFNHTVEVKGVTDQQKSGRCWLFSSLNILRPVVMEKYHLDEFEFSECYLSFYDKFEKANMFLEDMLDTSELGPDDREVQTILKYAYSDGGFWTNAVALIEKYGVVPKSAMPETFTSQNTDTISNNIVRLLKSDAVKLLKMKKAGKPMTEIRQEKRRMLADIYRIMVLHYGQPPKTFVFRYKDKDGKEHKTKEITPKEFYKEYVGVDLGNYVDLTHDPTQPTGKLYRIRRTRAMIDGPDLMYANCSIETLKDLTQKSILENEPVSFGCDVAQQMDSKLGIMALKLHDYDSLYGTKLTQMTKAERLLYKEATVSHAMVFVGVDLVDGKTTKWKVENSWGDDRGDKGYFTMYDSWFDEHVYTIVVNKRFLPEKIQKIFKQKPKELPQWYPLNEVQQRGR